MKSWALSAMAMVAGGVLIGADAAVTHICTDSREAGDGALYFAITGFKQDGHLFVDDALKRGAIAAVVSEPGEYPYPVILVDDTTLALIALARAHLSQARAKIIAITGSTGKTSTKEMIAAAIGGERSVLKSAGNLNTEIGLPLSALRYQDEEVLVLEMAMRGLGQIALLCSIAPPDVAVITNIGVAHLEVLGSRDNIAVAKAELLRAMKEGAIAVINRDDDYFEYLKGEVKGQVISYGEHPDADFQISELSLTENGCYRFSLRQQENSFRVTSPWPGRHNVHNATAALAAAYTIDVPIEQAIIGLASCKPFEQRLQIFSLPGDITVIDDTYNANPVSMRSALYTLADISVGKRRIAVLGDMLELGVDEIEEHIKVGELAATICHNVITVGQLSSSMQNVFAVGGIPSVATTSNEEAYKVLSTMLGADSVVLVKGSRGMHMEEIIERLRGNGHEA
ncbi:MAG: UDP-N-acetylmuramoyl-tripeptide--D-alanyl-D-alanine ligase [bacterium]|nr:UDP-N-acetylmuramoyl-tripeptide--D-alanyl-D-alanine ligase [bacterium]